MHFVLQLTADDAIKLADVGQTRRDSEISGTRCGTGCYSAPEVLAGLTHGCPADIFSLGMLLWELWYGKQVQADIEMALVGAPKSSSRTGSRDSSRMDAEFAVMKGTRPSLASVYVPPEEWKQLMKQCWSPDPVDRPSAKECYAFFAEYAFL